MTTATTLPTTGQQPADPADQADAPADSAGAPADQPGGTVWLTGLPSAGKTTVARAVAAELTRRGRRVEVLDGDVVRESLCADLGFSRADRDTNVTRIGFVAALLAKHGVIALAPVISPYAAARDAVRARHAAAGVAFLEVHVATPVRECAARDVKGLYARQRAGELTGLTGVDDPYEPPAAPELRVETAGTVDQTAAAVLAALTERGLA
ncbi:MAG TPA: adenylyl-sulfate kinase [Mycobacteriales bacterium]|nr:adenylyl-sulfate kinase [Mycobacteriales bacterium]